MIAPHMTVAGLGYLFLGWLAICIPIVIVFLLQERNRHAKHRPFYGRADYRQRLPNRAKERFLGADEDRAESDRGGDRARVAGQRDTGADERARAAGL